MRTLLKILVVLLIIGLPVGLAAHFGSQWLKERRKPEFRTVEVVEGTIRITRNATGEVRPVLSVQVGSFVSGPITELYVDFNDRVEKDQILAKIDPRIYQAAVARDRAALATRKAEVARVKAQLQQAVNDEERSLRLKAENEDFISQTELDQYHFARTGLEAQLTIASASVEQAQANLENSETNLEYTEIRAPVAGTIIDRKIDPGATLAAQFQTPELFVIAPDMQEKMHIFASIDEADIGLIRKARDSGQPVLFRIDAYPDELFTDGVIEQIRLSSTNTQNVVTYPVVVASPNQEMKLLPGMTAQITFQIESRENVLKVPNAAIRYLPESKEYVHEADHGKLDFSFALQGAEDDETQPDSDDQPVDAVAESAKKASTRHVWIIDGEKLRAVEIQVGVSDYQFTEVIGGDLKASDSIVTGLKPKS